MLLYVTPRSLAISIVFKTFSKIKDSSQHTKRQVKLYLKFITSQCLSPPCVVVFLLNFHGRGTNESQYIPVQIFG